MNDQEQVLLNYFRHLSSQDKHALLRYAGFLAESARNKSDSTPATPDDQHDDVVLEPQLSPRPEKERVVDALKRLSNAYPMLEKKKLLDKTSGLVAQHIMFGKPAKDIIDQLEKIFADAYTSYVQEHGKT